MKSHIHPILKSIKYAIEGIRGAFVAEPNFRIHIIIGTLVAFAGLIFKISEMEWLSLIIIISTVIILELINTSLEALTDLKSPGIHPHAKLAKDAAAGAVLVSAITAILVGSIIFLPKVYLVFGRLLS